MGVCQKIRWGIVGLGLAASPAMAQPAGTWTVRLERSAPFSVEAPPNPTDVLKELSERGHPYARIDSLARDTVFVSEGPAAQVGRIGVVGSQVLSPAGVTEAWATRSGQPYRQDRLGHDLDLTLQRYLARGYADARIRPRVALRDSLGTPVLDLQIDVDEGGVSAVERVEWVGARRATPAFVARASGLAAGASLGDYEPETVRRSVEATGLFTAVGTPTLARGPEGIVVRVPVVEGSPGAFDLVLGVLPPTAGGAVQVVGRGQLDLVSPLGAGRLVGVAFERNPGLVSSFGVGLSDPFVLGTPIAVSGRFDGYARDSTFSRQRVSGSVGYRVASGVLVSLTADREAVSPGRAASSALGATVRRSSALFYGAGLAFRRLDRALNPRRGLVLDASVASGRRERAPAPDSALASGSVRQQRLEASVRGFVPITRRTVLAGGLDARVLAGAPGGAADGGIDEGELFRIGGAATLRGYDEDAFVGRAVGRVFAEPRLLFDAASHAFAFVDVGVVDRPALGGVPASRRVRPGYGLGLQVQTGLGLARLSYALNPDLPLARGKLHVGLRVGL